MMCDDDTLSAEDAALFELTETMYMQQRQACKASGMQDATSVPDTATSAGGPSRAFSGADLSCNPLQAHSGVRYAPYANPGQQQQLQHQQAQQQDRQIQQQQQQQQQQTPQIQQQQQQQQQQRPQPHPQQQQHISPITQSSNGDLAGSVRSFEHQHAHAQPVMAIPVSSPGKNQRVSSFQNQNPTVVQTAAAGGVHTANNLSFLHQIPPIQSVKEYQQFVQQVLDKSDVEYLGGKRIVKRSGWRKLAHAFSVSFELLSEDICRDENYNVIYAKFTQRAILPNGRFADGWGACDHREKKFAKPNHDIAATAETRAKNRACADLFGIGDAKR